MNLLFQTRRPRRFHHEPIYIDERRDRLRAVERRAREELGMPVEPLPADGSPQPLSRRADEGRRFRFSAAGRHAHRALSTGHVLAVLVILLFVAIMLFLL